MTAATPSTVFKPYVVLIMITFELRSETCDVHSVFFFCVLLSLLYFADNTRVHQHLITTPTVGGFETT